jgi:hypothetical protein
MRCLLLNKPARHKEGIDYALTYVSPVELLALVRVVNSFVTQNARRRGPPHEPCQMRNNLGDAMYIE